MSQTQPLPPKKEVALALLERSSVFVHLDPRQIPVLVPVGFKKQAQLVLQVGLNMRVPIPDLVVNEEGISCTLSFNRTPFFCVVPWSSVFAMIDEEGRGMVWPDDVPVEVARQAQVRAAEASSPAPESSKATAAVAGEAKRDGAKPKRSRKRPALAPAPEGEDAAPASASPPSSPPATPAPEQAVARPMAAPSAPGLRPLEGGAPRRKRELPPYLRVVK